MTTSSHSCRFLRVPSGVWLSSGTHAESGHCQRALGQKAPLNGLMVSRLKAAVHPVRPVLPRVQRKFTIPLRITCWLSRLTGHRPNSFVCFAARSKFRRWEPGARLPEMSNFCCLPGRAGGSLGIKIRCTRLMLCKLDGRINRNPPSQARTLNPTNCWRGNFFRS